MSLRMMVATHFGLEAEVMLSLHMQKKNAKNSCKCLTVTS